MIRALALALAATVAAPVQVPPRESVVVAFVRDLAPGDPVVGAAVGALVTTTAHRPPCEAEIWLTLSAGARAALPDGCETSFDDWPAIVRANERRHDGAVPGALASAIERRGGCVGATGPLARFGAADEAGNVAEYHDEPEPSDCDVQLVDSAMSANDTLVTIRATINPDRIVLVGPPSSATHLGAIAVTGERGLLRGSTRRTGLVTLADVTAYVRDGTPFHTDGGSTSYVRDLDRREHGRRRYQGWLFGVLVALPGLLLYAYVASRRRAGPRVRRLALVLAALPAAAFVIPPVPWWPAGVVAVGAVLACVPTEAGVAAACAALFVADLLTGGHLQERGLASYSAIAGGRFYGLGNVGFAVLATAAVIATGAAARRWGTKAWLALVPVILVVALPSYGADFGGAITLTAALVTALATRARKAALAFGAAAGVALAMVVALADYSRPAADQTHLGRFVGEVLHGGWTDTLARKAGAAVHSVTGTWAPILVAGSVAMAVHLLRRLRDERLDPTVRVLAVLWVVGSLVNDSGVVVAAAGCAVAVPLLVAYAAERDG